MRRRYTLVVIDTGRAYPARSLEHALELVDEKVTPGQGWRVMLEVGRSAPILLRLGYGRRTAA